MQAAPQKKEKLQLALLLVPKRAPATMQAAKIFGEKLSSFNVCDRRGVV
jgi:hypothetical protein